MVTAAETIPGTDPDRASFTIALETAKETLTQAAGVVTTDASLTGRIGQAVLNGLLEPRRPRVSVRNDRARPKPGRPVGTRLDQAAWSALRRRPKVKLCARAELVPGTTSARWRVT